MLRSIPNNSCGKFLTGSFISKRAIHQVVLIVEQLHSDSWLPLRRGLQLHVRDATYESTRGSLYSGDPLGHLQQHFQRLSDAHHSIGHEIHAPRRNINGLG